MQKKTGPLQLCMSHRHVNAQVFLAQLPTAGQTSASQAEQRPHNVLVTSHSWEGRAQGRSTQHIFQNNFFLRIVLRQVPSLSWKQKKEQGTQRRKGRNELGWVWVGSGTERIRSAATNCQWVCNIVSNVLRLRLSNRDDTIHITLSDFCKGGGKKSEQECSSQKW